MKRSLVIALCAAAAAAPLLGTPRPAAAVGLLGQPPNVSPQLIQPTLFPGFQPFLVDRFGTSPNLQFLVFQDQRGLHVLRLTDHVETFSERVLNSFEVGFTRFDDRMFLLEHNGSNYRLRFIDPFEGTTLLDQHFLSRPEIRSDKTGSANLTIVRGTSNKAQVLVFDDTGRINFRGTFSQPLTWSLNIFEPLIAFLEPTGSATTRIRVIDATTGRITFQDSARFPFQAGFEPSGPNFVLATSTSSATFRVVMVNGLIGRPLLTRTFSGPVNAGFTLDGSLLGVYNRVGSTQRLYLFSNFDGRQVEVSF